MTRIKRAIGVMLVFIATQALPEQPAGDLALAHQIAQAGAPQLALDRASRLQPKDRNAPQWAEWEVLRCSALAALGHDETLLERAAALPVDARAPSLATCLTAAAGSALALGRYRDARRSAARALWEYHLEPAEAQAMRVLVIDAYAGERKGEDAYRAMLRYQQDYGPLPREVLARFVDGLLDVGMDKEALAWLARLDDSQAAKLRLRLRAGLVAKDAAVAQARAALAKGGGREYWKIVLDAGGLPLRVAAYEQLLDAHQSKAQTESQVRRLWDAYAEMATAAANEAHLLVGDDANWSDYAGRRLASEPAVARALFAHLAQHAHTAAARNNAQLQLLHAYRTDGLERVALAVFAVVFPDVDALDTLVRYQLGAIAEQRRQPASAARYWKDLPPPLDVDGGEWLVRVSRARWRSGSRDTGVDAVTRYYSQQRRIAPSAYAEAVPYAEELTDRGEADAARRLLEVLLLHVQAAQSRPALVALAHARESAGDFRSAAEAYLRAAFIAAGPTDGTAIDARLRAGVALARAGYADDARAQFDWVIRNAQDAALVERARVALKKLQL